jgi:nucleoside-diphosphate-sugar epimerase
MSLISHRVLIAVGAGFVGSHLCERRVDAGHEVQGGTADTGLGLRKWQGSRAGLKQGEDRLSIVDNYFTGHRHVWNADIAQKKLVPHLLDKPRCETHPAEIAR